MYAHTSAHECILCLCLHSSSHEYMSVLSDLGRPVVHLAITDNAYCMYMRVYYILACTRFHMSAWFVSAWRYIEGNLNIHEHACKVFLHICESGIHSGTYRHAHACNVYLDLHTHTHTHTCFYVTFLDRIWWQKTCMYVYVRWACTETIHTYTRIHILSLCKTCTRTSSAPSLCTVVSRTVASGHATTVQKPTKDGYVWPPTASSTSQTLTISRRCVTCLCLCVCARACMYVCMYILTDTDYFEEVRNIFMFVS
jgi:hypothetical protein